MPTQNKLTHTHTHSKVSITTTSISNIWSSYHGNEYDFFIFFFLYFSHLFINGLKLNKLSDLLVSKDKMGF